MPNHSTPFDQGLFLVHLNRGREHFNNRNFTDAAEELEEARRLRPDDDTVLNLLGLAYFKQENYKDADGIYRKLLEFNAESFTLHFNLGLICFKLGDLDRAEATFLRALELKPENQKTHFYLGNIYEKKRQYYNAIFQYRKAGANIMVKRVQEKIDSERPSERREGEDFSVPTPNPDPSGPSPVASDQDKTAPNIEVERVTVDHIDRRRFLSALQEGPSQATRPDVAEVRAEPDLGTLVTSSSGRASDTQETLMDEDLVPVDTSDTLSIKANPANPPAHGFGTGELTVVEEGPEDTPDDDTLAPAEGAVAAFEGPDASETIDVPKAPKPDAEDSDPPSGGTTRLRLNEPVIQDESLAEMTRNKVPGSASADLFSAQPPDERRGSAPSSIVIPSGEPREPPRDRGERGPQRLMWSTGLDEGPGGDPSLYGRMRRRDDIFRYLENNLMEVNFSGKVFIKQGTIYSYSGNLTFWVKPQREESVPPLVIVSGTGKLLLTDRQRDISVIQVENDEIFVEPSHLLACQETLTPRYAVIEKDGRPDPRLHVLLIEGSGMLALSVATNPLLLNVQKAYPVNVSSSNIISWSGQLQPTIVEDDALTELMLPRTAGGVNLRLEGEGRVMMEKADRYS